MARGPGTAAGAAGAATTGGTLCNGAVVTPSGSIVAAVGAGEGDFDALCTTASRHLKMAGWRVDYVALRDAATLQAPTAESRELVVLGAAWLGTTRLIDNIDFAWAHDSH